MKYSLRQAQTLPRGQVRDDSMQEVSSGNRNIDTKSGVFNRNDILLVLTTAQHSALVAGLSKVARGDDAQLAAKQVAIIKDNERKDPPMARRRQILVMLFVAAFCGATSLGSTAEPVDTTHPYSEYEKLVVRNVSKFHVTFNAHEFAKNGELVADNFHGNSNGVDLNGRAAFVQRIARFVVPFPDVRIHDIVTIVDGNRAAVSYIVTGTQDGDLETPEGPIRATHKHVNVQGSEFFTFDENGKLIDLVTIERVDQLLQQLKSSP